MYTLLQFRFPSKKGSKEEHKNNDFSVAKVYAEN